MVRISTTTTMYSATWSSMGGITTRCEEGLTCPLLPELARGAVSLPLDHPSQPQLPTRRLCQQRNKGVAAHEHQASGPVLAEVAAHLGARLGLTTVLKMQPRQPRRKHAVDREHRANDLAPAEVAVLLGAEPARSTA